MKFHNLYNWDTFVQDALALEYISKSLRKEYIESIRFLREELKEDFFKSNFGKQHPIVNRLFNRATWQIEEIIDIATTLRSLKSIDCNYSMLLKKIRGVSSCRLEGIPLLQIASGYIKAGFTVKFEPTIDGFKKKPDIEVFNPDTNEYIYIEVSKLNDSDERNLISNNFQNLYGAINRKVPILPYYCKQLDLIPDEAMHSILNTIFDYKKSITEDSDILFYKDTMVEFALAHPSKSEELRKFCKKTDNKYCDMHGLTFTLDDTERIRNSKINREAEQIPPGSSGLIYIPVDPLYFIAADLNEPISGFQSRMHDLKNIIGIVTYSNMVTGKDTEEFEISDDDHYHCVKLLNSGLSRDLFFVSNNKWNGNLTDDSIKKMYRSFQL